MKKKLLKAFGIGIACAGAWMLAQVATYTTLASIPAVSPGGTINFLSDMPQFLVFNATSAGSRNTLAVGSALGTTFVATDQTTTSSSFVALSTADLATVTCAATCNVVVQYMANCYHTGGATVDNMFNAVFIDTVQVDDGNQVSTDGGVSLPVTCNAGWRAASLSAASHTIEIRHKVTNQTGHWRDRTLMVLLTQ
jgi:hypothetical protein